MCQMLQIETVIWDDDGVIFHCPSQSTPGEYHTVAYDPDDGWFCTCEDYHFRKHQCKHMVACMEESGIKDDEVFVSMDGDVMSDAC